MIIGEDLIKKDKNMLEGELIALSIKDFFTKPMLKIAILPLVFTLIIMLIMFYTAAGYGFDSLEIYIQQTQNGQDVVLDEQAPFYFVWMISLSAFLLKYSITSWLVGFLIYTVGTIFNNDVFCFSNCNYNRVFNTYDTECSSKKTLSPS